MKRTLSQTFAILLAISTISAQAEEILLRLQPAPTAPVVTRIIPTEKVLIDAAPVVGENWQKLELIIPFEGYVPTATLNKGLTIVLDTPVHFLPDANSEVLTQVEEGDIYELVRAKDEWTTVRFQKRLVTYFQASPTIAANRQTQSSQQVSNITQSQSIPEPPVLNLDFSTNTSKRSTSLRFKPDVAVGQTSPDELPPENVVWKSAPQKNIPVAHSHTRKQNTGQTPSLEEIMVGPAETQAREGIEGAPESSKPLRLLTGNLVREISTDGPTYTIRLRSPEGRLIAYVDLSGVFIEDLSPFIDQPVFLRGQIFPIRPNDSQLLIYAEEIRLANIDR